MSKNSVSNRIDNIQKDDFFDVITPDVLASIKTIHDLWSLAKITKDINGDQVWEALYQMGYNPEPFDNIGYKFDYGNYKMLYIPKRKGNNLVRFALPKLACVGANTKEKLLETVNTANSLVRESKFALMGEDVWLIHERRLSDNEDYCTMIEHILENLKLGAEIFHAIS